MSRTKIVSALCALALVALSLIPVPATQNAIAAPEKGDHLVMGILPDTQFYSRYATEETGNPYQKTYGSEPYDSQTRWLAETAKKYGTEFVMHLGDVVDQANHPQQWDVADRAMQNLENGSLPYSVLAGNHDIGNNFSEYLDTFPAQRQEKQPTLGGLDPTGLHSYHVIDHDGQKVLVLALSWGADQKAFDWANSVLDANPDVPTIVTSHQLINISADATSPLKTDFGERVWNNVIKNHDQVFLTFNGHHHGAMTMERTNANGNPVLQVLIDHQMAYMGGNGLLSMLDLDFTHNTVKQTTLSPWVAEKPADTLQPLDVAYMDNEHATFTWDFDFRKRFPNLKVSDNTVADPTSAIRDWASSIKVPDETPLTPPANAEDYPHVDGTVAHWKPPVGKDGEVAQVGAEVEDVAGGNTFRRAPLNRQGVLGAKESDVTFSSAHSQYSANAGSVCFANANKKTRRASYFTTDKDAAINSEEFPNGYTMETFIKVDKSYDPNKNAWMAWLGRDGKRSNLDGYTNTEGDEPPLAWAFSSLNEIQFSFVDSTEQRAETSLWSGEIVNYTEWMHLAVVNDPETKMSTLYVDGVPMLRNGPNTLGLASDKAGQWLMGAGTYGGLRDSGFVGCMGETRIVDHAIGPDQWLTARAEVVPPTEEPTDEPTDQPTEEPSEEPTEVPTDEPSEEPTTEPSEEPTDEPSEEPTEQPSEQPSEEPTTEPTDGQSEEPTDESTDGPTDQTNDDTTSPSAPLPRTGVNVGVSVGLAGLLIAAGVAAVVLARRKN